MQTFDIYDKNDWWDLGGRLKTLHWITPLRFEYFKEKALFFGGLSGKTVLDIGCGGGLLSERFAEAGAVVTGIDLSSEAIDAAKEHAGISGLKIDYSTRGIKDLSGTFDVVVCSEVLEHTDDLATFIKEAGTALKKGGLFFFSTINKTLKAKLLAIVAAERLFGLIEPGTHDEEKFIRPSLLVRLLRENSIDVEEIKGISLDPLSFSFRISRDTSVNYMGYGIKR